MTAIPGLSHVPPDNEDNNTKALRAQGITATPQLKLGTQVRLTKNGHEWQGFVLSIDRTGREADVIVNWITKPANAGKLDNLGLFRASQMASVSENLWEIDPSTVS